MSDESYRAGSRFGHFTAAVLIGWILLAPSIDCARRGLQRETPLSEWEHVDSFSSRESCEDFRATVIDAEKSDSEKKMTMPAADSSRRAANMRGILSR